MKTGDTQYLKVAAASRQPLTRSQVYKAIAERQIAALSIDSQDVVFETSESLKFLTNQSEDGDNSEEEGESLPQPNKSYRFLCSGVNEEEGGSLYGKKVEWEASFDGPLEEFIYPSLQKFNWQSESSYGSTSKDHEFKATYKSTTTQMKSEFQLPRWKVQLSDTPIDENDSQYSQMANAQNLDSEIEKKGDAILKSRLKESAVIEQPGFHPRGWPSHGSNLTLSYPEMITEAMVI